MDNPKTKITVFLALTLALSSIPWAIIIEAGNLSYGGGLYVLATMWAPGVAALLTRLVTQRDLRGMGWSIKAPKLLGLAYILPLLYALPVYLAAWATGLGRFDPSRWADSPGESMVTSVLVIASLGALQNVVSAAGEEIGWRGLLLPELSKITSFRNAALISGAVWALWHMPLIIGASYHGAGTPIIYSVICFTLMILALSFLLAWIRLRSESVWPAVLLHATHNLWVQGFFDAATVKTPESEWWTGEFGAGLAITIGIVAVIVIRRGRTDQSYTAKAEAIR